MQSNYFTELILSYLAASYREHSIVSTRLYISNYQCVEGEKCGVYARRKAHIEKEKCTRESRPASERGYM